MVFYGAGGHAKVVIEAWISSGGKVTGIFDDDETIREILNLKVLGPLDLNRFPEDPYFIAVGVNRLRKELSNISKTFGRVVHPFSALSNSAFISEGTAVLAGTVVNADTWIGKHVIINSRASVDHDCKIGDFVHIAPSAVLCGGVVVGEGTLIGAGAVVLPGIHIGSWSVIGAGAVVNKNISDGITVLGNPARQLKAKTIG